MITHKSEVGEDFPVYFMRKRLQGAKLNYPSIDKQAFVVFKSIKHFQSYLLRSHNKIIVHHSRVGSLLIQKDLGDR